MPCLTSKALLTDTEGLTFLRAVLTPGRQPAVLPRPTKAPAQPASKSGERRADRVQQRALVAGS